MTPQKVHDYSLLTGAQIEGETYTFNRDQLKRLLKMVAAIQREECAQVAERFDGTGAEFRAYLMRNGLHD